MTDNALSRPFTRAELYVTKRKTPRGRPCATRYNFVVLTINQCKARANIYFPNSILRYISDGSRVAFSWFTALATASDGALIFRISASDWEARLTQTPLYIAPFAAFDPPTDYYGYGTPSASILCSYTMCQPALIIFLLQLGVQGISLTHTNSIALLRRG